MGDDGTLVNHLRQIFQQVLPKDPVARRNFVASQGLRKLQEILKGPAVDDLILTEHIQLINQCFPEDVVKYFSPDYPQTLLDRVEQYRPALNIDPSLWSERLFSDSNIPAEIKEEILALQQLLQGGPPLLDTEPEFEEEEENLLPPPPPLADKSALPPRKQSKKKSIKEPGAAGDTGQTQQASKPPRKSK